MIKILFRKHGIWAVLILMLIPCFSYAQGGPPLITDDPGTPGDGHWEINLALATEQNRQERLFLLPIADINYGVGKRIQLKFEIPWLLKQENQTFSGLGSAEFGIKWRFVEEGRHGFSLSCYPQFSFGILAESARHGLAEGQSTLFLPLEFAAKLGRAKINLEVGYAFHNDEDEAWSYGILLARRVSKRLELAGELHGTANRHFGEDTLVLNVGGRWNLGKRYTLLVSMGTGLRGPAEEKTTFLSYVGVRLNY